MSALHAVIITRIGKEMAVSEFSVRYLGGDPRLARVAFADSLFGGRDGIISVSTNGIVELSVQNSGGANDRVRYLREQIGMAIIYVGHPRSYGSLWDGLGLGGMFKGRVTYLLPVTYGGKAGDDIAIHLSFIDHLTRRKFEIAMEDAGFFLEPVPCAYVPLEAVSPLLVQLQTLNASGNEEENKGIQDCRSFPVSTSVAMETCMQRLPSPAGTESSNIGIPLDHRSAVSAVYDAVRSIRMNDESALVAALRKIAPVWRSKLISELVKRQEEREGSELTAKHGTAFREG